MNFSFGNLAVKGPHIVSLQNKREMKSVKDQLVSEYNDKFSLISEALVRHRWPLTRENPAVTLLVYRFRYLYEFQLWQFGSEGASHCFIDTTKWHSRIVMYQASLHFHLMNLFKFSCADKLHVYHQSAKPEFVLQSASLEYLAAFRKWLRFY